MFRRIRIQNYRSIRDVTVELGPVTVLVGKSGTGKTNFITAIRFVRDIVKDDKNFRSMTNFRTISPAMHPQASFSFEAEFDIQGYEESFTYSVAFPPGAPNSPPIHEYLRHGGDELFHQTTLADEPNLNGKPRWISPPPLISPPPPGELAIGRLPGLEKVALAYSVLTSGIGVYSFPFSVLNRPSQNGAKGLHDNASNYVAVLQSLVTNVNETHNRRQITAALSRLNGSIESIDLNSLQHPNSAVVGHRLGDKVLTMDLAQESDGFRRFYAHLLALYQLPPKQLLVFEEPENGIYPGALTVLADEFKAAAESNRGQILLTTHSPRLLDHFDAEEIRVVELDEHLQTRIGPLAHEQRDSLEEDLLSPGELLTVDPARMEAATS